MQFPDWASPFLAHPNVVIAPSVGSAPADTARKQSRRLARAVLGYLVEKDLALAVNAMDVVAGRRKRRFPAYRGQYRSSVPILWSS